MCWNGTLTNAVLLQRIKIPSVVILHEYHEWARLRVNFTKRNIFIRDLHRCQYCGKAFPVIELTCDHVLASKPWGTEFLGEHRTCCRGCNRRKGQRTDIRPCVSHENWTTGRWYMP